MSRVDHSRRNMRDKIVRQGEDSLRDMGFPAGMSPPKPRPSKRALRAELEQAEAKITRLVHCPCGHKATIAIPAAWRGRTLACSKCGARCTA